MFPLLKNLKLSAKLNVLLLLIFLVVVTTSGLVLSKILEGYAEDKVASQAFILLETMSSIREYTADRVTPELSYRLDKEEIFFPQTVPSYSVREVFEKLRSRKQYSDFFYKDATLNPTNPRDRADSFETTIVENFRNQSELKELTGFRSLPSEELFYAARPLTLSEESCLRCHSTPDKAPKSMIATYGSENGFGWKLNEIIGAKIVSVPASAVFNEARHLQVLVIGSLSVFFLLAMILINLFLKFAVTRPLKQMAKLSRQVSTGNMDGEFQHPANDEIGVLAASLNRMKVSLEMAIDMLNTDAQE